MSELYLLRHGESEANVAGVFSSRHGDPALSPLGEEEAWRQGEMLAGLSFARAFSSPLLRARQTSAVVCPALGLHPEFDEDLLEVDVGELDGKSALEGNAWPRYDEVRKQWEAGNADVPMPGGESLDNVRARLRVFLEAHVETEAGRVLVVGHGMLFMTWLWLFCENRGPTLQDHYMGRGHLSVVERDGGLYRLRDFNLAPPGCMGPDES